MLTAIWGGEFGLKLKMPDVYTGKSLKEPHEFFFFGNSPSISKF